MIITDCFVDPVITHCDHGETLDCGKCALMGAKYSVIEDRAAVAYLAVMAACLLGILLFTLYFRLGAR